MDPQETLRLLNDALDCSVCEPDYYEALEHARNLSTWLERGGWHPGSKVEENGFLCSMRALLAYIDRINEGR